MFPTLICSRMRTLARCLLLLACAALSNAAQAAWPERPIRILVGYAAGGSTDVVARLIAPRLAERLGQPVVIENKPGGAGDLAAEVMLQTPADGYTLLMSTVALHAINPGLTRQRRFDPVTDFSAIAMVASYPLILVASPQTSFRTLAELRELARSAPPFYSSSSVGSPGHLAAELLARQTGVPLTHVPYKGGAPSVLALMTGEVQLSFATLPAVVPQIRAGKVRAIAIASTQRSTAVPEVPTMIELGVPGFDVGTWAGLVAPRGLAEPIIEQLHAALTAVLAENAVQRRLSDEGAETRSLSPAEFAHFIRSENTRWTQVVRDAGIQAQ